MLGLPAPAQRQGQLALTDQTQLALPRPAPRAGTPNASLAQRGFGADDFQQAGMNPIPGMKGIPKKDKLASARQAGGSEFTVAARRKAQVFAARAKQVAEAAARKVASLEKKLKGKESRALQVLKEKALTATQNKLAAKVLVKTLASSASKQKGAETLALKAKKAAEDFDRGEAAGRKQAIADQAKAFDASAPAPVKELTRKEAIKAILKGNPGAKGLSKMKVAELREAAAALKGIGSKTLGKQGGFINTDAQALLSGGVVGGALTATQTDNPLAIAAGAIGGAAGIRAFARSRDKVVTNKMRAGMRKASSEGGEYKEKLSRLAKAKEQTGDAISDILTGGKKTLDSFLGATMTRIEAISPRIATALAHSEYQQSHKSGQWLQQGDELFKRIKDAGLSDTQLRAYKIALLNSTENAKKYLRAIGKNDAAEAVVEFDAMLKQVGGYLGEVSLGGSLRKNYFPRLITDFEQFEGIKEVDTYLAQVAKKKGTDLTDFEKENAITEAINGALTRGNEDTVFGRAASQLQRRTTKVTGQNVDAYADPHQGFNDYIEGITTQVERRRFFKGQNVKVDDLGANAENIDNIAVRLKDQLKNKDMTPEEVDEVAELLKMRFGPGEQAPHRAVQNFKNLTYTGLLGNPMSAMTQAGDLALSAYKNGIRNTVSSVVEQLAGKGKLTGLDKTSLLGIRNAAADFASKVGTRDLLNGALRYSGFQHMDELGKNTFINAAMKNNQQMDTVAFKAKWKSIFDPDAAPGAPTPRTDALMDKVKNFKQIDDTNREDVGFMLWNELSGTQPIALSALPEQYLKNPNGRMGYMLQSFTLKMFDVMRKDVYNNMANKQYMEAAKNATKLTSMFVAGNSTVDAAKNFILQRDSSAPEVLVNNTLKMFGASKFMVEQATREGVGSTLLKTLAPPTALFDAIGDGKKAMSLVPVVGRNIAETIE